MHKELFKVASIALTIFALGSSTLAAPEQSAPPVVAQPLAPDQAASAQAAQKVVQQFFTAMMKVDDVKGMKEAVAYPFCSVFVSPTDAYRLRIDKNEAEFEKRFAQLATSFEDKPKSELEAIKQQFAQATFSEFVTTLQGDSAYVTCSCRFTGDGDSWTGAPILPQKLISVLQKTKSGWKIIFTTLPT